MLNFKIDRMKLEGVQNMTNEFFPSHFLCLLVGKPGSGKTSLLKYILKNENLLFKKYDKVYIISPSYIEYKHLFLKNENFSSVLDWSWVYEKIANLENEKEYQNVLFVFDDVISDLNKDAKSVELMNIIFNRRHLLKNGMISVIITSQKYKCVPVNIRGNINVLIAFKLSIIDKKQINEEIFNVNTSFEKVCDDIFTGLDKFLIYRTDYDKIYDSFKEYKI